MFLAILIIIKKIERKNKWYIYYICEFINHSFSNSKNNN